MKVFLVNEGTFDLSILQSFINSGACSLLDIDMPVISTETAPVPAPARSSKMIPHEPTFAGDTQTLGDSHHHVLLGKAKAYIDNNYMDPSCSLLQVAKYIHMSHSHLSLLFKEAVGTTFINYLTEVRIKKAKQLLASTDLMVYEIATRVGYENATYFSTVFKKATGLSPKEYRSRKRIAALRFDSPRTALCQIS